MNGDPENQSVCIATHSGTFHADDLFAVAALQIYLKDKETKVVRTRDQGVFETCDFVLDVGGIYDPKAQRFDHHQGGGAGARENGVPYAAFGLVWKAYGREICGSQEIADHIDRKLVQTIDALDNGVDIFHAYPSAYHYLIHNLVFAFRPSWREKERSKDDAFMEVLPIVRKVLRREVLLAQDEAEGRVSVEEVYANTEDKRLIILEEEYPWQEVLSSKPEVLFVVMPDDDDNGNWKVRTVRTSLHSFENKKDLPASWAGKRDEELEEETGVEGAVFCHNKRFIAVAHSKEGALKLAHLALEA